MSDIGEAILLCAILGVLVIILVMVCLHLYQIFEEPGIQKRMRQLRKPVQPWVTVLLFTRNNDATVEASLKALVHSRYHQYDIVVVDDGSSDQTRTQLQEFIKNHPKITINHLRRRMRTSSDAALKAGYRKSKKGEVVISLKAGTIVPASFLKRAVAVKQQQTHCTMRVREPIAIDSFSSIVKTLRNLVWHHSRKVEVSDAKNITVLKDSVHVDFLGIIILGALIVASLLAHEVIIYWYSWLIVTSYVAAVIWLHEEKVRTKLSLSFSALSALFLLPVASIVMAFSQFHSRN